MHLDPILIHHLGLQHYNSVLQDMHNFTDNRNEKTKDEIWLVEHFPVFTQGRTKKENLLLPSNIQVVQSDRGGQMTYHGPGQQLMYVLLNLKRRKLSVRKLIYLLEESVSNTLAEYGINSHRQVDAPGVYVEKKKICSLGLCVKKGCSMHGLALNVNMNLSPFLYINPCGFKGMKMTQMSFWEKNLTPDAIRSQLVWHFLSLLKNHMKHVSSQI